MAAPKQTNKAKVTAVFKRTNQGGGRPKTSSMNKSEKRSYKAYRGQGR
jgi:hypothetical protein